MFVCFFLPLCLSKHSSSLPILPGQGSMMKHNNFFRTAISERQDQHSQLYYKREKPNHCHKPRCILCSEFLIQHSVVTGFPICKTLYTWSLFREPPYTLGDSNISLRRRALDTGHMSMSNGFSIIYP